LKIYHLRLWLIRIYAIPASPELMKASCRSQRLFKNTGKPPPHSSRFSGVPESSPPLEAQFPEFRKASRRGQRIFRSAGKLPADGGVVSGRFKRMWR